MLRDFLIRLGVSEATAAKDARKIEHLVYFLCFVKTLRKEPETPES